MARYSYANVGDSNTPYAGLDTRMYQKVTSLSPPLTNERPQKLYNVEPFILLNPYIAHY